VFSLYARWERILKTQREEPLYLEHFIDRRNFKAMMSNACLFEIISNVHLCSSWVGSGIAQRTEGHLSFAVSHKKVLRWCFVQGT